LRRRRIGLRLRRDRDFEHFVQDETKRDVSKSRDGLETDTSRLKPDHCHAD